MTVIGTAAALVVQGISPGDGELLMATGDLVQLFKKGGIREPIPSSHNPLQSSAGALLVCVCVCCACVPVFDLLGHNKLNKQ